MARQGSKSEDKRFLELQALAKNKQISYLVTQPVIPLYTKEGICIASYTPDYVYYDLSINKPVIEEHKGAKGTWAYKRADYSIFRRWCIADYPEFEFRETFSNGSMVTPKLKKKPSAESQYEGLRGYLDTIKKVYG